MTFCRQGPVLLCAATACALGSLIADANAATVAATYQFNNTLAADESSPPALTEIDPLSQAGFVTDNVAGINRTVYHFAGNAGNSAEQGGLSLDTSSVLTPDDYSVEMIFKFTERNGAFRRIYDAKNRQEDDGFYVSIGNHLTIYLQANHDGPDTYVNGEYHHVAMTVSGNVATAYLDGAWQVSVGTSVMNIANDLLYFFTDNETDNVTSEYSAGDVALIRLYDGALNSGQVTALASQAGLPEPASVALLGAGVGLLFRRRTLNRPSC